MGEGSAKRTRGAPPGWDAKAGTHINTRVHKCKTGIKVATGSLDGLKEGRGREER